MFTSKLFKKLRVTHLKIILTKALNFTVDQPRVVLHKLCKLK